MTVTYRHPEIISQAHKYASSLTEQQQEAPSSELFSSREVVASGCLHQTPASTAITAVQECFTISQDEPAEQPAPYPEPDSAFASSPPTPLTPTHERTISHEAKMKKKGGIRCFFNWVRKTFRCFLPEDRLKTFLSLIISVFILLMFVLKIINSWLHFIQFHLL